MKKRYVVFVSSTYTDLIDERQAVSKALLRSNCFPSQMENWPAMDAEQMEAIRQLIDECDYYLVVTAGKYGSVDKGTGLSYTELEYDYALSVGKPIIRLLHKDPFSALRGDQIEDDPEAKRKLQSFRTKLKTGSVCSFWTSPENLMIETILALNDVISRRPTDGWVRAETVATAQEQQREFSLLRELIKNIDNQNLDVGRALGDLPVPVMLLTQSGDIISFNSSASALVGDALHEGVSLTELMEGLGRSPLLWIKNVFEGSEAGKPEFLRLRRSEQEIFVQMTISPVDNKDGRCLLAVLTDATELKTLEAQFVQNQKMQAMGQLVGGVAHDFNNLLTAISGHCDLLLLRHDQGDPDFSDLVQINQNSNRAAALVGQLLAFARKQTLRPETIDLRDTLADMTHLMNRLVGQKVSITLSFEPTLPPLRVDKRQLEQVILNLIVNARDAMPNGGTVAITAELCGLSDPLHRDNAVVPAGSYIQITVADEGIGIKNENLQKIFEPFFTTKYIGAGVGMGLATCYGIVKQSGGFIFVDSGVGLGTKFTLYFPVHESEVAHEESTKRTTAIEETSIVRGEGVILLVDDEPPVRSFAARALRIPGYRVIEKEHGEAALEWLRDGSAPVDLIISNVVLPGADGPTWVKEALKIRPGTPVIFISGYAKESFDSMEAPIPNSVFLPKPFSLNDIVDVANTTIKGHTRSS